MRDKRQWAEKNGGDVDSKEAQLNRNSTRERTDRCVPIADGGRQISAFLDALAEQRRRYVIWCIRDKKEAGLEGVTEQVAAWEHGMPSEELNERVRKNVRIDLYHVQLPKLEEVGLLAFDHQNKSLRYRAREPVERFLDDCPSVERPEMSGK